MARVSIRKKTDRDVMFSLKRYMGAEHTHAWVITTPSSRFNYSKPSATCEGCGKTKSLNK